MAQDGRLVAHLHRIPALVDLIDEDWRHEHLSHDDFDLPSVDFDEDSDDVRTQPKRKQGGGEMGRAVSGRVSMTMWSLRSVSRSVFMSRTWRGPGEARVQRIETNLVCP